MQHHSHHPAFIAEVGSLWICPQKSFLNGNIATIAVILFPVITFLHDAVDKPPGMRH